MARPKGDLGAMVVGKADAAQAVPHVSRATPQAAAVLLPKALTVKLTGEDYARLRSYCHTHPDPAGREPSHQAVVVQALRAFLNTEKEA